MEALHIYQILTPHVSRQDLDPGFEVLDNSANERPDWFEYWPIRRFLLKETLDENAFYGFLSPKFKLKTGLTAEVVREFVLASATDVVLFSPSIHNSAYYLNVFEHGDSEHPGLKNTAREFFERLELPSDLDALVSDSRNTVYSNYFVAKPHFWRAWLAINEKLYAIAEASTDTLGESLRAPTRYRGGVGVQMKIFILERMATWLLTCGGDFTARVHDPFAARSRIYKLPTAIVCDALKIAFATQRRTQYRDVFLLVRGLHKILNFQIRLSGSLAYRRVAPTLRVLKSYWMNRGQ